jgi:hypothetical protein
MCAHSFAFVTGIIFHAQRVYCYLVVKPTVNHNLSFPNEETCIQNVYSPTCHQISRWGKGTCHYPSSWHGNSMLLISSECIPNNYFTILKILNTLNIEQLCMNFIKPETMRQCASYLMTSQHTRLWPGDL